MKYFKIEEFTCSLTAQREGIENVPTGGDRQRIRRLVTDVLDPLRERWGGPIIVSSGYRSHALNERVGGAAASYHLTGCAADVYPQNGLAAELFRLVKEMYADRELRLSECYHDVPRGFIHIAYDPEDASQAPIWTKRLF